MTKQNKDILFRMPVIEDGYAAHQLIAQSPPLDLNSVYSYYILSDHFRNTCVVAEHEGKVVGFLSAYRVPEQPETLFVWQVVVNKAMRGQRVAWRMLESLLKRFEEGQIRFVEATVNPSNIASRKLFEHLAREQGTSIEERTYLEADAFGASESHESEILLRVPLNKQKS
jgi:L-2,4-diaminobutyric acid acetyltransferase